jgi:hypothetical protein
MYCNGELKKLGKRKRGEGEGGVVRKGGRGVSHWRGACLFIWHCVFENEGEREKQRKGEKEKRERKREKRN